MDELQSAVLLIGFLLIAWMDARKRCIPNKMLVLLILTRAVFLRDQWDMWRFFLPGFFVGGGLMLMLYLCRPGQLGGGDVKLCAVLGLYLGWEGTLRAIFYAAVFAALSEGIFWIMGNRENRRKLPFGTFLLFGVMMEMLIC